MKTILKNCVLMIMILFLIGTLTACGGSDTKVVSQSTENGGHNEEGITPTNGDQGASPPNRPDFGSGPVKDNNSETPEEYAGIGPITLTAPQSDLDDDGVPDTADNCVKVPNPDQEDMDDDRVGDACDHNIDGDLARNEQDAFPKNPMEWSDLDRDGVGDRSDLDDDNDGIPDLLDVDADSDGVADFVDNCPMDSNEDQLDLDNDSLGNLCDTDKDSDGFNLDSDCNDLDPMMNPLAMDLPDAGNVDMNCDGVDGVREAFWVAPDGDDANPGTIDQPFRTITRGIEEAIAGEGVHVVNVVEGFYPEDLAIGDHLGYVGIRLFGGFGPLDPVTNSRERDIGQFISKFLAIAVDGRSGAPVNGRETVVDGFHLSQVTILNASPNFADNSIILDGLVCEAGATVMITTTGNRQFFPMFRENLIENLNCDFSDIILATIAVQMDSHDTSRLEPTFDDNDILSISGLPAIDVVIAMLGTAFEDSHLDPHVDSNDIFADNALAYAAGINIWSEEESAQASLDADRNLIRVMTAPVSAGVDLGFSGIASTVELFDDAKIDRNTILGGTTSDFSTGVTIRNARRQSLLLNNFIHAGLGSVLEDGIGLDNANADILNNTLVADSGTSAILIDLLSATGATSIVSNIFFGNAGPDTGISEAPDGPPASLINNLFDPTIDVLYASPTFGNITTTAGLTTVNAAFTPNFIGSALLADPANLDFHLMFGSAAIDGVANGPRRDVDNDDRPIGAAFDIGADEAF